MRLRNRKSYVTTLPEGAPEKKPAMSLVRLLYFAGLAFVLLYLLFYAAQRLVYVEAAGYVAMERHLLQTDRKGTIRGLELRAGEAIQRGQRLFRIEQEVVEDRRGAAVGERLKMRREIGLKQAELAALEREIEGRVARQKHLAQLKLLELDRERYREFALLERELAGDRLKAEGLRQELAALRGYQGGLGGLEGYRRYTESTPFASPFDGFVYRVEKGEHEFAHEGDTVLVLEDAGQVRIHAYFSLEDLPRLRPGKAVELMLPDGHSAPGRIARLDSASAEHADKLSKGYQPLEALVRVEITPLEAAGTPARIDWRRYNQLDVKVRFKAWD